MRKRNLRPSWTAGLMGLLAGQVIHAQTVALELEEVVVTGSRVVKNGNDSPTPVTVVSVADSEQVRPATIAEQLNDMPQFSGSQGQQNGIGSGSANGGNPNGQANVLNLRNFGQTRTLILFDGHRVASTSPNGTVDVDMIPQILLQRVDVVTGGASAVYGADAVTGVVNFITDKNFSGMKINGQVGQSDQNDDRGGAIGIAWGGDLFGGRGHMLASYEYRGDEGVDRTTSREWFRRRPYVEQISNTATLTQFGLVMNATNNDRSFGGVILPPNATTTGLPYNQYFISNGVLAPVDFGIRTPVANISSGGSGAYFDPSLKGQLKMHQVFARMDYDFTDTVHGYFKASGTKNYNAAYSLIQPTYNPGDGTNIYNLFVNNPYLTAQQQSALTAAGVTRFRFLKVQADAPRQFAESNETQYSIDTGLNGEFGDGWSWEVALVHASNQQEVVQNKAENGVKMAAALDAVTPAGGGAPVCWVTTQPQYASKYSGCVPYNAFGPTSMTQANIDYMFDRLRVVSYTDMNDVEAFLSGAPFNSWAGPITTALSAQARKSSYHLDSNNTPSDASNPLVCPELRLATCGTQSQTYLQAGSYSRSEVSVSVKEAALEFDLPLLKDVFLARDVSLNGAVRYTNYSTSGTVYTWKAGLDWKFNNEVSFRGTRSRDIRAPTLFELYRPTAVGNLNTVDPYTLTPLNGSVVVNGKTVNSATTYTTGNPNLDPETGDTTTLGIVYRPDWAPGFSASVDYYYINVTDAILQLNTTQAATAVACPNSGGTSPVCALIIRPIDCCTKSDANAATAFYSTGVNVARNWTTGADVELSYANRLFDKAFSLRLLASYQPHNVIVNPITGGTTENAGFYGSSPTWRATLVASFSPTENLKVSVQERYRNAMSWTPTIYSPLAAQVMTNAPSISSVFYTNLNVAYTLGGLGGKTEIYLNVANLFDREAPIAGGLQVGFPGNSTPVPGDDVIGRYYTLGFRYRM